MVNGGTVGPLEMTRPLARCNQQVVIEVEGRDGDVDEQAMEDAIDQAQQDDVSVSVRQARSDGDKEIVVATRGGIVLEEQVQAIQRAVNNQIIQQKLGFEIREWRIEA